MKSRRPFFGIILLVGITGIVLLIVAGGYTEQTRKEIQPQVSPKRHYGISLPVPLGWKVEEVSFDQRRPVGTAQYVLNLRSPDGLSSLSIAVFEKTGTLEEWIK